MMQEPVIFFKMHEPVVVGAVLVHLGLVHLQLPHILEMLQAVLVLGRVEDFIKLV